MSGRDRKVLVEVVITVIMLVTLAVLAFLCVKIAQKDAEPKMIVHTVNEETLQELTARQVTFSETAREAMLAETTQEAEPVFGADEIYSGMSMSDVAKIQIALRRYGYDVEVDGKYEMQTDAGVRCFQRDNGLEMDGICGENTLKALGINRNELVQNYKDYFYTPLAGERTEYFLYTNTAVARTILYHWTGNAWEVLVDTNCIVGASGSETPTGVYEVLNKDEYGFVKNNHRYTNTLVFYVPNGDYTKAYCYHSYTKDMDGNVLDSGNERFASKGCIRLPEDALTTIFSVVPVGSDVLIH